MKINIKQLHIYICIWMIFYFCCYFQQKQILKENGYIWDIKKYLLIPK